mmetsp:Transcript_59734/g.139772  ORF Transcript_59734/g.139772 Transcript_59734/m.139772 type:complete len:265 (-) Transcript_59734:403-1197(-)
MGAVEAEDVSTSFDHLGDHFLAPGRWSQAGHNLCPPLAVIHLAWLVGFVAEVVDAKPGHQQILDTLRFQRGCSLGHDGFAGELAACSLTAEHDGICTIPDGVLKVTDLGPGRNWVLNHAFDHLRGVDHEKALVLGLSDEVFLRKWHPLELQLDAQVSPGHHQSLGLGDDAVDVGQGLGLLDLGADLRALLLRNVEAIHDVDELLKVLALLHEGDADVLDGRIQLQEELSILDVLGSQRGAVNLHVWHVHTLAGLQRASTDDFHL